MKLRRSDGWLSFPTIWLINPYKLPVSIPLQKWIWANHRFSEDTWYQACSLRKLNVAISAQTRLEQVALSHTINLESWSQRNDRRSVTNCKATVVCQVADYLFDLLSTIPPFFEKYYALPRALWPKNDAVKTVATKCRSQMQLPSSMFLCCRASWFGKYWRLNSQSTGGQVPVVPHEKMCSFKNAAQGRWSGNENEPKTRCA